MTEIPDAVAQDTATGRIRFSNANLNEKRVRSSVIESGDLLDSWISENAFSVEILCSILLIYQLSSKNSYPFLFLPLNFFRTRKGNGNIGAYLA